MANFLQARSEDFAKLLLRVTVGGLLLFHGVFKLAHGIGWLEGLFAGIGWPGFVAYLVYVGEVLAPVLLILGFRTRIAALLIAIDLLVAIVLILRHQVFSIREAGGGWGIELEAFFILTSLALFFMGGGKYKITGKVNSWD